jgi:predicted DNA-binding protein (MmcQ/YjbR family)
VDLEQLREYVLGFADVEETLPFGPDTLVYKVLGKIFLLVGMDNHPLQFNVKCDPDLALELREEFAAVMPGYHMNKKHWNTIIVDGSISAKRLYQFIDHSYSLVCGKNSKVKSQKSKKKD